MSYKYDKWHDHKRVRGNIRAFLYGLADIFLVVALLSACSGGW